MHQGSNSIAVFLFSLLLYPQNFITLGNAGAWLHPTVWGQEIVGKQLLGLATVSIIKLPEAWGEDAIPNRICKIVA